jgi:hypothetical protein
MNKPKRKERGKEKQKQKQRRRSVVYRARYPQAAQTEKENVESVSSDIPHNSPFKAKQTS